tara:strand:+ start:1364 stop:1483 length:120 start_codon:yes stop_codon:yes gene_type:complete
MPRLPTRRRQDNAVDLSAKIKRFKNSKTAFNITNLLDIL